MNLRQRIIHALRSRGGTMQRPRPGRIVQPEAVDRWRDYPADGLTPRQLATILKAADQGAVDRALALYEQMEEKDAHLHSVANTRRLAVTGLPWQIVSAAELHHGVDRVAAAEAAAFCQEALAALYALC